MIRRRRLGHAALARRPSLILATCFHSALSKNRQSSEKMLAGLSHCADNKNLVCREFWHAAEFITHSWQRDGVVVRLADVVQKAHLVARDPNPRKETKLHGML